MSDAHQSAYATLLDLILTAEELATFTSAVLPSTAPEHSVLAIVARNLQTEAARVRRLIEGGTR